MHSERVDRGVIEAECIRACIVLPVMRYCVKRALIEPHNKVLIEP